MIPNIEYVKAENLQPAPWRANYILRPDYLLLRESMDDYGWLYPIIARSNDNTIIDGFHRWVVATERDELGDAVPVVWVKCDEIDAMVLHLRLNRAKGALLPKLVSGTVRRILHSKKFEPEDLRKMLHMGQDEFDVLADGTLVKMRNVKEHKYSAAWVPVETSGKAQAVKIERPPTPDG